MNRYYSDSDDAYYASRSRSGEIRASGWQSPTPAVPKTASAASSSIIRIPVDCPFGLKRCDYAIDKSQRGRLIVTARRRHTFSSDYLSPKSPNDVVVQTFTIPSDADVNRLQSYVDRYTNRLIIEIPRLASPYARQLSNGQIYDEKRSNRKLEYRVDCQGFTADEIEVFIEGYDLFVQGKTRRALSADPSRYQMSKKFSRKISLPSTVDLAKVISYFENGHLKIEAPLKRDVYARNEYISSPRMLPNRERTQVERVVSPRPGNRSRQYRRRERYSRRQPSAALQRVRSADALRYPPSRSTRDFDDDEEEEENNPQYQRTVTYRKTSEEEPAYRSVYAPPSNVVTTRTAYHDYPRERETSFHY